MRVPETNSRHFSGIINTFNTMVASLERSDQQRRNLTADVAHELRTPLQIILGNLEGVLDGVYEPTTEHIAATLEATHQLARLVEDLRTLSLAESGQLALEFEAVDVTELLLDTQTSFSGLAESAGIALRVAAPDKPLIIHGDPGRLDQVMGNLVVNAVRHTPRGGDITLEVTSLPGGVEIRVCDTGAGITPEDLPFIFDRFWRGDRARTHHEGAGSGLGLAITRQLVRLHGGTIDVDSSPGHDVSQVVPGNHRQHLDARYRFPIWSTLRRAGDARLDALVALGRPETVGTQRGFAVLDPCGHSLHRCGNCRHPHRRCGACGYGANLCIAGSVGCLVPV